jgi:hypothetical protein
LVISSAFTNAAAPLDALATGATVDGAAGGEHADEELLAGVAKLRKKPMDAGNVCTVGGLSASMSHAVDSTRISDTAILCAVLDLFLGSYACPPSAAAATGKDAERTAATEDVVDGSRSRR